MIDRTHYDELYRNSMTTIQESGFSCDSYLFTPEDQRYGITVILRLKDSELVRSIQSMLEEFRVIEPDQYYYPATDLHVTVLGLIECHNGFSIKEELFDEHKRLVREALEDMTSFFLEFKGITLSPSCILVQGFPDSLTLDRIRDSIRDRYSRSSLEHSIDSRYVLKTAHVTAARFIHPITDRNRMIEIIESYRERIFGVEQVVGLELVRNDWCVRKNSTELIAVYPLERKFY